MVHVSSIFSVDELEQAIADGFVRFQNHPTLPLRIYNYTEQTQFTRRWNKVTLATRGLILDHDYNIVARPFKKFFNLGEGYATIDMTMPVEVTDKMDGSLGILWNYNGEVGVATRGSFQSEQADEAMQMLRTYRFNPDIAWEYTFCFEIIYPENRVVIDYGQNRGLVLLGAVNNWFGYYLGPREAAGILEWDGPVVEVFGYRTMQEAFNNNERPNAEGYVIRSGDEMIKLKQTDYVELHRIVTNLNARTVWKQLGQGKTVQEICEPLPDEFHEFVKSVAETLWAEQEVIQDKIFQDFLAIPPTNDRKEFARQASKSQYRAYLFMLYDGKPISDKVWETLKPDAKGL